LNLGLAAAAWNIKKWINELLFALILWLEQIDLNRMLNIHIQKRSPLRAA
jgi:hypothetical protein